MAEIRVVRLHDGVHSIIPGCRERVHLREGQRSLRADDRSGDGGFTASLILLLWSLMTLLGGPGGAHSLQLGLGVSGLFAAQALASSDQDRADPVGNERHERWSGQPCDPELLVE